MVRDVEHLVIGSGIAGLTLALKLADRGKVLLLCKGNVVDSNTWLAQGGIASVFDDSDSFANHILDTEVAGAGLCHHDIVKMVVSNGPRLVQELHSWGAKFTSKDRTGYHLTKEGGHSHRRVVHAADITGQEVAATLIHQARRHEHITILEDQFVVDLLTTDRLAPDFNDNGCCGAYVLDRATSEVYVVRSRYTYLCTGGHGKAYLYTSNPDSATGDGLAIGWRAGCKVANLEFMQFHPTCLFNPQTKTFLISEALRGEGAILKDYQGKPFMEMHHPLGSLAPRDIVARAIDAELKKSGAPHVYLDARPLGKERLQQMFPNIFATCLNAGIDISASMIPVVPAAHYSCGGIVVDEWGRTSVNQLYAIGEVACTGLHGANRLASNSLLEALVFADRVAQNVLAQDGTAKVCHLDVPAWHDAPLAPEDEMVVLSHTWDEIRRLMWHYVGIVRSEKRLKRALARIVSIRQELDDYYWNYQLDERLLEVRNLALVSWLTIRCAIARKESRGIHYMADYPEPSLQCKDTVLQN